MKYKGVSVKGLVKNIFTWVGGWRKGTLNLTLCTTDTKLYRWCVHTCDFSPLEVEAGELQVEVG